MSSIPRGSPRVRGFTLIEVVVAFAVMALMIGALYGAWGAALQRSERARYTTLAILHAESLLERLGVEWSFEPLRVGEIAAGGSPPFRYRIFAQPVFADAIDATATPATETQRAADERPVAYRVRIEVHSSKLAYPAEIERLFLNVVPEPTEGR